MQSEKRGAAMNEQKIDTERPHLLIFLGGLSLLGCVALIGATIVAPFYVPDYNWIADTISDLAAGDSKIIMDYGLFGFAAGLLAASLAASHAHVGNIGWSIGTISLAILALLVTVIGARDEYGDGDTGGVVIHIYLVYGLGVFFLLAPLCMSSGAGRHASWAKAGCYIIAGLWAVTAPVFFFLPTGIDGLYERMLGGISCAFVVLLSVVFIQRALRAQGGSP
ncbi:DUF998 domain-containing protein [Litoreibacter arenae]|uniref:DUF998 domain-containing protein n=1 Tax=Litoreibacter arenae DSM 19593 TaxID=1123360 RepID=S9RP75_9RHOB|nr:DUF998 domain-containing protein [Litoreibacter arenae]EPX79895.1 hypothetical protein thalar_01231 [Litoreibacter arenae DSM 19593]